VLQVHGQHREIRILLDHFLRRRLLHFDDLALVSQPPQHLREELARLRAESDGEARPAAGHVACQSQAFEPDRFRISLQYFCNIRQVIGTPDPFEFTLGKFFQEIAQPHTDTCVTS
jgi:hypothetical protein